MFYHIHFQYSILKYKNIFDLENGLNNEFKNITIQIHI